MKKTVTVNLNGKVYNIDEDAYERLKQYLDDTESRDTSEEREQVMQATEAKLADFFDKKLHSRQVVELADVEEIVAALGQQDNGKAAEPSGPFTSTYSSETDGFMGSAETASTGDAEQDETEVEQENSAVQDETFAGQESPKTPDGPERNEEPDSLSKALRIIGIVFAGLAGLTLLCSVLGIVVLLLLKAFGAAPWLDIAPAGVALLVSFAVFQFCPGIVLAMVCWRLGKPSEKRRSRWPFWVLLAVWIVSIIAMIVSGVKTFRQSHSLVKDSGVFEELTDKRPFLKLGGTAVSEWRNNGDFHAIDAEDAVIIRFRQSDTCSVRVMAPSNTVSSVRTDIRGGVLYIRNENCAPELRQDIEVLVCAPSLDQLKLSESCSFRSETPVKLSRLDLEIDEASTIVMSGEVSKLNVRTEEEAKADLTGLAVGKAEVRADEASSVNLGQVDDLRIRTSGASTVTFKGRPKRLQRYSSDFMVVGWEE